MVFNSIIIIFAYHVSIIISIKQFTKELEKKTLYEFISTYMFQSFLGNRFVFIVWWITSKRTVILWHYSFVPASKFFEF